MTTEESENVPVTETTEDTPATAANTIELTECLPCAGKGTIRLREDEHDIGTEVPCRDCAGEGKVALVPPPPPPTQLKVHYDSGKQVTLVGWFQMIQWPLGKVMHAQEPKATLLNFDKIESVETEMWVPPTIVKVPNVVAMKKFK